MKKSIFLVVLIVVIGISIISWGAKQTNHYGWHTNKGKFCKKERVCVFPGDVIITLDREYLSEKLLLTAIVNNNTASIVFLKNNHMVDRYKLKVGDDVYVGMNILSSSFTRNIHLKIEEFLDGGVAILLTEK